MIYFEGLAKHKMTAKTPSMINPTQQFQAVPSAFPLQTMAPKTVIFYIFYLKITANLLSSLEPWTSPDVA
jgi:hypothetical protein